MAALPSAALSSHAPRRIDALVAAAAVGALIAALAAVDLGGLWLRRGAQAAGTPVSVALAGRAVSVPAAWIAKAPETGSRLDLAIPFPDAPDERLFVTAVPAQGPVPGLGPHHARFLSAVARSHPGGLV